MPACLLPYLVQHIDILVKGAKSFFFSSSLVSREVLPDQYYIFKNIFQKGEGQIHFKNCCKFPKTFWHKIDKKSPSKNCSLNVQNEGVRDFLENIKKTALLVREGFPYIEMFSSVLCICQCICTCIPMYLQLYSHVFVFFSSLFLLDILAWYILSRVGPGRMSCLSRACHKPA